MSGRSDPGSEWAQETIDNIPVMVYRTTPDGRILAGNRAVEDLLGYTVEEFTALHADALYFDPGEREPFMQSRMEGGDVVRTVLRLKHKDGHALWVEDVGRAIMDKQGNVQYFDGTIVDITDRVEAERQLREREEMLQTIHDKAPIAIFNLDPDGRVFQANPQAHRMLGLPSGGLLGKTISEFTYSEDAKESFDAFMQLKSGDRDEVSLDKRYRRVDGKAIWGNVRAVAVRDPDGSFSHTISLVQDITQRKRTEEAFRLLDDLTRRVNESGDLEEAMKTVLDSICTSIGFRYGEVWVADDDGRFTLNPAWHGEESRETMKLRHISKKLAFGPNGGVPAKAVDADEALWFEDLSHDQTFVRAGAAAAAGLRCALSVPVRTGSQVFAMLLFMDSEREPPQEHTLRLVKFLADRLGNTLARHRLEMELEKLSRRMKVELEGASDGVLVTSGEGAVLMVNRRFLEMCGVSLTGMGDGESSMDVFDRVRSDPSFMDLLHRFYEDRAEGEATVEVDEVKYGRRSMPLPDDKGGRVWYFRPIGSDGAQ